MRARKPSRSAERRRPANTSSFPPILRASISGWIQSGDWNAWIAPQSNSLLSASIKLQRRSLTLTPISDSPSPDQLQPELNLPRACGSAIDHACGRRRPRRTGGKDDRVRRIEVGSVQNVEELRSELKAHSFRKGGVLHQR